MMAFVYFILAGLCAVGGIIFGQMGLNELQPNPRPEISMNVENNQNSLFSSKFFVANGGDTSAKNVKVEINHFDYIAKRPDFVPTTILMTKLNESDNYSRFLGEIKKNGDKAEVKINDIISYDNPKFAISELGSGSHMIVDTASINSGVSNPTVFVLPVEEKPFLKSSLICFSVYYQWDDKGKINSDEYKIGFFINKDENGLQDWTRRSEFCDDNFLVERKKLFAVPSSSSPISSYPPK